MKPSFEIIPESAESHETLFTLRRVDDDPSCETPLVQLGPDMLP